MVQYEILVVKDGDNLFTATGIACNADLKKAYDAISAKFTAEEGYDILVFRQETTRKPCPMPRTLRF